LDKLVPRGAVPLDFLGEFRSTRIAVGAVLRFLEALLRPERAVRNARAAAIEASRRQVERYEVDQYLADRPRVTKSA
jgi:hypothetical protein